MKRSIWVFPLLLGIGACGMNLSKDPSRVSDGSSSARSRALQEEVWAMGNRGRLKAEDAQRLIAVLETSEDGAVLKRALWALSTRPLKSPRIEVLAIEHEESSVRRQAVRLLFAQRDAEAIRRALIKEQSEANRREARALLLALGGKDAS